MAALLVAIAVLGTTGAAPSHALMLPPPPEYSLALTEDSGTTDQGGVASTRLNSTVINGGQTLVLSATGVPDGVSVAFAPELTYTGGGSDIAVIASPSARPGTYPITIVSTATPIHTVTYTLTVTPADPANDFSFSLGAPPLTVDRGSSGTLNVDTATIGGDPQEVALSAVGVPSGMSVGFEPATVTTGGRGVIRVSPSDQMAFGTYPILVYAKGTLNRAVPLRVVVRDGRPDDFSVRLLMPRGTAEAGSSVGTTVMISTMAGRRQNVTVSSSGAPPGGSVSIWPTSTNSDAYVTVRIGTARTTPLGTYPVTLTVTGSVVRSQTFEVTVKPRTIPAYQYYTWYNSGDVIMYEGVAYRCVIAHTSMPGWEPPNVPSVWSRA
ncbi:carbohydrate-binding protein [Spongiactinospora sp. TRM90649]|uniref:carbohydrate-binding protein n=1 Tax=Spongiactinospora sp. TRM90649 TaxID=3031114 RepID=UPI0023F6CE39|nr:carbohydrate-binding protein [Spongiactinospora sp. TRM90649]MDF5754486.1 hypothetical protein [Spongiactinospora sp. TRM90649]